MVDSSRTLILLDIDGVLVYPWGYKAALRATVDHFASRLGQPEIGLSDDEIAIFEACGITNEWDSGAICASELLLAALRDQPDLRRNTLEDTLAAIASAGVSAVRPDFTRAARQVAGRDTTSPIPALTYLEILAQELPAADLALVSELLADVHSLETITTQILQTHTLGSQRFVQTYHRPAPFESESCLTQYDLPQLSAEMCGRLLRWQTHPAHGAAIFTARPSLPPPDVTYDPLPGYAPEAELAVELLGVDGQLPLIGQGRISWVAELHGRVAADYVKPSPVQALAAIGAAVSRQERAGLQAAATLIEHEQLTGPLADLSSHSTRVIVYEDAVTGIYAAQRAVERLHAAGLDISFEAVGVSPHPDKRAALATVANRVVDDINQGLKPLLAAS